AAPKSLPDQPYLRHLTSATVAADAGRAAPAQGERAAGRGLERDVEFDRLNRRRLLDERMHLDTVSGVEADHDARGFAAVDDSDLVLRCGVEAVVAHRERRVLERLCVMPPRGGAVGVVREARVRRLEKRGIVFEACSL